MAFAEYDKFECECELFSCNGHSCPNEWVPLVFERGLGPGEHDTLCRAPAEYILYKLGGRLSGTLIACGACAEYWTSVHGLGASELVLIGRSSDELLAW